MKAEGGLCFVVWESGGDEGAGGVRPDILLDGTHVRLLHWPGDAERSLVVFGDEVTGPSGRAVSAFGASFPQDADVYEVLPREANWYPAGECGAMAEILAQHLDGRDAVAIGASMGGYGALRHGGRAGCDTVLAFAPQARISPDIHGLPQRLANAFDASLHAEMEIGVVDVPRRAYAVFDPAERQDRIHAVLLRDEAGVEIVGLAHMGHRTDRALSGRAAFDGAIAAAVAGDRPGLARVLRRGRRELAGYLARLSMACSEHGHYRWAASIAAIPKRKGDALAPDLRLALAVARAGLGHPFEMLEEIEALIVASPQNARYWRVLAEQYESMGQMNAAADVLELALEETENFLFCWKLIRNRMTVGAYRQARMLADLALEHWPERRTQIERVRQRIGEPA